MKNFNSENKKSWLTPPRVFLGVLSLGALGFGFWALTRNTNKPGADGDLNFDKMDASDSSSDKTEKKSASNTKNSGGGSARLPASDFPLRKGSRGEKVKLLQQTLLAKYPGILKSGADGIFGNETAAALLSKGLPSEISENQFSVLTAVDPSVVADNIYKAANKKDFNGAIAALRNIKTTKDYSDVNEKFKDKRLNDVSSTIVTGLLDTFPDQSQKDQLNIAFSTMGLEKKDGKWYVPSEISGIRKKIMTTRPTKVWRDARHMVQVGNNTILGYEVKSEEGITQFDTIDGYRLYVMTAHIKYN